MYKATFGLIPSGEAASNGLVLPNPVAGEMVKEWVEQHLEHIHVHNGEVILRFSADRKEDLVWNTFTLAQHLRDFVENKTGHLFMFAKDDEDQVSVNVDLIEYASRAREVSFSFKIDSGKAPKRALTASPEITITLKSPINVVGPLLG